MSKELVMEWRGHKIYRDGKTWYLPLLDDDKELTQYLWKEHFWTLRDVKETSVGEEFSISFKPNFEVVHYDPAIGVEL